MGFRDQYVRHANEPSPGKMCRVERLTRSRTWSTHGCRTSSYLVFSTS
ncbi:hypothetical protein FRUB_03015 [Fimbriiglobus ruber]|uniref:Uncharacterized protein n=1 Tax=Fimbriiglobus ruber TaxID=1908690 RepID=A0A225E085_9BACT|nr:hypothetical protein FRUB_03015 [Fimbriiglobus ruber]